MNAETCKAARNMLLNNGMKMQFFSNSLMRWVDVCMMFFVLYDL
jgi:hypothetical protein